MGDGPLAVFPDAPGDAPALSPADGEIDGPAVRQTDPLHHRVIPAAEFSPAESGLQPLGRQLIFRRRHESGCPPVQPIDGPEGGLPLALRQVKDHPVAHRVPVKMPGAGVDGKPRRLVEEEEIPVLINDVQGARLGGDPLFPPGIGLPADGQQLPRRDPAPHRHPLPVQENAVLRHFETAEETGAHPHLPPQEGEDLLPLVRRRAAVFHPQIQGPPLPSVAPRGQKTPFSVAHPGPLHKSALDGENPGKKQKKRPFRGAFTALLRRRCGV